MAQDPADAEYSAMPQNAIATGEVELVLPAAELAPKLVEYARTAVQTLTVPGDGDLPDGDRELMQKILTQVRARSGYDFSRYKYSTLMRRIQRRMQLHGYDSMAGYLAFVREHADEAQTLFADFLITVTNFFRDAEAFAVLEQEVIPELFRNKTSEDQVRVWVTGCATGEEAYSLGMLLLEYAHQTAHAPGIQIFATDLSETALRRARGTVSRFDPDRRQPLTAGALFYEGTGRLPRAAGAARVGALCPAQPAQGSAVLQDRPDQLSQCVDLSAAQRAEAAV